MNESDVLSEEQFDDGVMHTRCRNCGCALDKCGKTDEEEKRADARG